MNEDDNGNFRHEKVKTHHDIIFLSDHDILSREWRVIVDPVQTNYHGRPMVL